MWNRNPRQLKARLWSLFWATPSTKKTGREIEEKGWGRLDWSLAYQQVPTEEGENGNSYEGPTYVLWMEEFVGPWIHGIVEDSEQQNSGEGFGLLRYGPMLDYIQPDSAHSI